MDANNINRANKAESSIPIPISNNSNPGVAAEPSRTPSTPTPIPTTPTPMLLPNVSEILPYQSRFPRTFFFFYVKPRQRSRFPEGGIIHPGLNSSVPSLPPCHHDTPIAVPRRASNPPPIRSRAASTVDQQSAHRVGRRRRKHPRSSLLAHLLIQVYKATLAPDWAFSSKPSATFTASSAHILTVPCSTVPLVATSALKRSSNTKPSFGLSSNSFWTSVCRHLSRTLPPASP